jgi:hypothetical protein
VEDREVAGVDDIVKQWVQKVEATGELARDPQFGKPFDLADGYDATPAEWRLAFKILRNAGYAPVEVDYFKRVAELKETIADPARSEADKEPMRAELRALELEIAFAKERFRR